MSGSNDLHYIVAASGSTTSNLKAALKIVRRRKNGAPAAVREGANQTTSPLLQTSGRNKNIAGCSNIVKIRGVLEARREEGRSDCTAQYNKEPPGHNLTTNNLVKDYLT